MLDWAGVLAALRAAGYRGPPLDRPPAGRCVDGDPAPGDGGAARAARGGGLSADAEARAARIRSRLDTLFEIGRAEGTNRPGLGAGEQQAYEQVAAWMGEAGLEVSFDAAGNLYGRLRGSDPSLPEIWSGSHLDTPPDGGRFDGALGVVSALDAAEAIRERRGRRPDAGGRGVPPRGGAALRHRLLRQPGALRHARAGRGRPARRRRDLARRGVRGARLRRAADPRLARACSRRVRRDAHRAGPAARRTGRTARSRDVDRRHARHGAHVLGAARPRRHGADGAALRRARGRRPLRARRARQRARDPRRGRDDRPAHRRARGDEHDPEPRDAVRRRAGARRRASRTS